MGFVEYLELSNSTSANSNHEADHHLGEVIIRQYAALQVTPIETQRLLQGKSNGNNVARCSGSTGHRRRCENPEAEPCT